MNLSFLMKYILGDKIPYCSICEKPTAVLNVAIAGGSFVEVCDECLKYGEKIEFCEIDNKISHYNSIIEVINVE